MVPFVAKLIAFFTSLLLMFQSVWALPDINSQKTDFDEVKNVIFMIGDGMGFNSLNKTKHENGVTLVADSFALNGRSRTSSADNIVTDSAAGGTALATGVRTANGALGVYMTDKKNQVSHPMNLTELAISMGKLAGVITTDSTAGATPSAFSVHVADRDYEDQITPQQLASDLTLMWGGMAGSFTAEAAAEYGWTHIYDEESMMALEEGSRSFGQFTDALWHAESPEGMPTLAEMTSKAIDLLDDDEDGFFLMVEGAHIDKNNHSNNGEGMKDAVMSFDAAIAVALEYAEAHEGTLVIVTADHETGGIVKVAGEYYYTNGGHTAFNVPLLVYGCDDFINDGQSILNTEIARRVACAMGEPNFPIEVSVLQ